MKRKIPKSHSNRDFQDQAHDEQRHEFEDKSSTVGANGQPRYWLGGKLHNPRLPLNPFRKMTPSMHTVTPQVQRPTASQAKNQAPPE